MPSSRSLSGRFSLLSVAISIFCLSVEAVNSSAHTTEALLSSGNVVLDDKWQSAYNKAKLFVDSLTNDEKISVITASDAANWTAIYTKDGSQGAVGYYGASGFSEASALAQTWDKDMIYAQSVAVAAEIYGKGFQVINSPTSSPLGRTPYSGRLGEALGQDVYLNGIIFGLSVAGYQKSQVIAEGKHFLLYEQETNRSVSFNYAETQTTESYSSVADDKTLHETYMFPFYDGVKAGMGVVMCAMNRVNGTASCENGELLNKHLKNELGFPGFVIPDVGAQTNTFESANGGLDYGSSSFWSNTTLLPGIENGTMTQARLDDMAIRNVIGYYYVGLDEGSHPSISYTFDKNRDVRGNHSKLIRAHGAASLSLLKNVNNALPLSAPKSMAIFGAHAGPPTGGASMGLALNGAGPIYQGHLAGGTGSGSTTFNYMFTPYDALNHRAAEDGTMFRYIMNDTYTPIDYDPSWFSSGYSNIGWETGTGVVVGIDTYAEGMDVCIVFINALSGEGADRSELRNADQDALVNRVAAKCNNTMVVVNTVGPRILDSWIENDNVTAVIYGGLLGEMSGYSIVDVLYGDVNPSGKLHYTIAKDESDYPVGVCMTTTCNFTEGNYIDYKYFDAYNVTPRYEFGYGLSYTTFSYSSLSAVQILPINTTYAIGPHSVGGRTDLWDIVANVSAVITNSGSVDGHEVVQLYVEFPEEADQPIRSLRGFEKIWLTTGESGSVTFPLRRRDLSYWDVAAQEWAVAKGTYQCVAGASSRDLREKTELILDF